MSNELIVLDRNEIAQCFEKMTAKELFKQVEEKAKSVVFDLSKDKEQKALRSHVHQLRRTKTAFDNFGKELKEQYTEVTKKIDEERSFFRNSCDSLIDELLQPLVEIELKEANRKKEIQDKIDHIKNMAVLANEMPSIEVQYFIDTLEEKQITSSEFMEFETDAKLARFEAIEKLKEVFSVKIKTEEAEKIRIEEAEKQCVQAEKEREEKIKAEAIAQQKKEAEAELSRLQAEKLKIEEDAKNFKLQYEQKLKEQQEKAKQARITAEENARQAVLNEQKRVADLQAKEQAELKAKQANKDHQKAICLEVLNSLIKLGLSESQAKTLINNIHSGKVPHVSINY